MEFGIFLMVLRNQNYKDHFSADSLLPDSEYQCSSNANAILGCTSSSIAGWQTEVSGSLYLTLMSSFGNPRTRKTWAYWTKSCRQSPGHLRDWKHKIQGEVEVSGFVQPGDEMVTQESSCCFELPNRAYRKDEARLFEELHRERTRHNNQLATKKILSGHRKKIPL